MSKKTSNKSKPVPQRKNHKSMTPQELLNKYKNLNKPKGGTEKLSDTVKNRLKDFDRFSIN